ncbi:hypothetical protein G6F56_006545 [Rhizopus delemar]|nr:hypothetical protein G6F56_006545 [Rhizopus delemar]
MLLSLISLALVGVVVGKPLLKDGVYVSCNRPGIFAMTFDDGPYQYSWDLAKSLNEQGIHSTFFINGKNWV